MKKEQRKEVFLIIQVITNEYHKLSVLMVDALHVDCVTSTPRPIKIDPAYPRQWDKAFEHLDDAIQELNESVGRDRNA